MFIIETMTLQEARNYINTAFKEGYIEAKGFAKLAILSDTQLRAEAEKMAARGDMAVEASISEDFGGGDLPGELHD